MGKKTERVIMNKKSANWSPQLQIPASAPINWNLPELLERLDNDRIFLGELLIIFRQDSQSALQGAKEAFAGGDCRGLEYKAHTLKGMLRNLLMDRAAHVAADLEVAARQQNTQHSAGLLAQLSQTMEELLPEVDAQLAEVKK
jgi:two-component system, sensor histidine kinase and response regulator